MRGKRELQRGAACAAVRGKRRGGRRVLKRRRPLAAVAAALALALLVGAGALMRAWGGGPAAPVESQAGAVSVQTPETALPAQSQTAPVEMPAAQSRFVLSFLGDCTLTSSHYTNHFETAVGDDLAYPFSNVAEILTADNLTLANLECSFSDQRLGSTSEYAFCGQPKYARSLALGGVEWVSMANNHTDDFGAAGVTDTLAALEGAGVGGIAGDESVCVELRHEDGSVLRVGVYVLRFNGSAQQMRQGAERLRQEGADIVVACMHAGAEKIYVPTKRQTSLAHAAIDGGADLVIGTHPHVLQPEEQYKDGLILYSIGNFCFGGNRNPGDKDTVIAQLTVETGEDGVSWEMAYIPCGVSSVSERNDYRPTPYGPETAAYQRCLDKLRAPWDTTTAEEAAALAAQAAASAQDVAALGE